MPTTIDDILATGPGVRAFVMGVLNVTPDSFSDAGAFFAPELALTQARQMIDEGADLIDIGAESTRPGSDRVSASDQIARLRTVLPGVVAMGAPVSIDTTLADVADWALEAGAAIINDVSAGRDDHAMLPLAARRRAPLCLMHMQGAPKTMQANPHYTDVVAEVRAFLAERILAALAAGVDRGRIIVDPGIGFGKRAEHNLALLANVQALVSLGRPVLVGPSRKRFIAELAGEAIPPARVGGTIAACLAARTGGATIFRVHDVAALAQGLAVHDALAQANK